ncbi:hypothetical protein BSKO_02375 [Bryopsis sp. KO-2023]|nr:hypothetical protein BSKO_02375 [Bryopsis sp. KO-2023]
MRIFGFRSTPLALEPVHPTRCRTNTFASRRKLATFSPRERGTHHSLRTDCGENWGSSSPGSIERNVACQSFKSKREDWRKPGDGVQKQKNRAEGLWVWLPLVKKIFITIAMLGVIRTLYFLPINGINLGDVPPAVSLSSPEQMMLEELFLAGGSIPLNMATLGITPIVFSGMIISLLLSFKALETVPFIGGISKDLRQRQKNGSLTPEEIDRKTNRYSLILGAVLGYQRAIVLQKYSFAKYFVQNTIIDWLGALAITKFACTVIQDNGLGEGTGFLILGLTLSGLAGRLTSIASLVSSSVVPIWKVAVLGSVYLCMVALCVWITEVEVRIPTVDYNIRVSKSRSSVAQDQLVSRPEKQSYLPLPISQSGVTAIFLCSAWFSRLDAWIISLPAWAGAIQSWPFRLTCFGVGIFLTCLIPIGVTSPSMISEFLVSSGSGIKGVLPGDPTMSYLKWRMFEARFWGGLALGIICSCCLWLDWQCRLWIGSPFGTLNLVLLVAVISSSARQVEAMLEGPRLRRLMTQDRRTMLMSKDSTIK